MIRLVRRERFAWGQALVAGLTVFALTFWLTGCIAKVGPVVLGIGQVEVCSEGYAYDDATGRYKCPGEWIAGAAISEQGSRVVGGVADAARSTALQVIGVPPPRPAPKEPGP